MLSEADMFPAPFLLPSFSKSSSSKLPVSLDGFTPATPSETQASMLGQEA